MIKMLRQKIRRLETTSGKKLVATLRAEIRKLKKKITRLEKQVTNADLTVLKRKRLKQKVGCLEKRVIGQTDVRKLKQMAKRILIDLSTFRPPNRNFLDFFTVFCRFFTKNNEKSSNYAI